MKPRIVEREAFHVVGLRERFLPGKVEGIGALWERFLRRAGEVRGAIPGVHYGVCIPERHEGKPLTASPFGYMACVGVESLDGVPEGMAGFTVPAGTYAVWTHRGLITELKRTLDAIWHEWMPAAGLTPTGAPDFELYDARFTMDANSEVDLYVPVVPKT